MGRHKSDNPRVYRCAVMLTKEENDILDRLSAAIDANRAETLRKCMKFTDDYESRKKHAS